MITDIPTEPELESAAILLVMAWDAAVHTIGAIRRSAIEEWDTDGTARAEYDAARQPAMRHARVWIHQAQELGLKARIAAVSPYLLLSTDPRGWPRPGPDGRVSFNEFRTIDAVDLVRVHDTVCTTRLPADFVRRFEEDRKNCNKIVHLGGGGVARQVAGALVDRARVQPGSRDALLGALLDEGAALLAASKAVH